MLRRNALVASLFATVLPVFATVAPVPAAAQAAAAISYPDPPPVPPAGVVSADTVFAFDSSQDESSVSALGTGLNVVERVSTPTETLEFSFDGDVATAVFSDPAMPENAFNFGRVRFRSTPGAAMAPGVYSQAGQFTDPPAPGTTSPQLGVAIRSKECAVVGGSFRVLQFTKDAAGAPTSFAADYRHRCEGQPPTVAGSVRWNSTVPFVAAALAPVEDADFDAKVGTFDEEAFVLRNTGTGTLRATTPVISSGSGIGTQFSISGDTCSGQAVAPGGSCTITVRFTPTSEGQGYANLRVPDNSPLGHHNWGLFGAGHGRPQLAVAIPSVRNFEVPVGVLAGPRTTTIRNVGDAPMAITEVRLEGDPQFAGFTDCPAVLAAGLGCDVDVYFLATRVAASETRLEIGTNAGSAETIFNGVGTMGYAVVSAAGGVRGFGDGASRTGSIAATLGRPVAGGALTVSRAGHYLVDNGGGIFAFGDAVFRGSTGAVLLNQPIVGMAVTPTGRGYWLVARDGGIFAFGDARFFGSTGGLRLNQPIVGMAPSPTGRGYWLVASDGGIFAFGDARFMGSTGNIRLNQPIVGMTTTPLGDGYWMVASDGGIFAFGKAVFRGSTGNIRLNQPVVGMAVSATGRGYWMAAKDGGIFNFGDAVFMGAPTGQLGADAVAILGTAPIVDPDFLLASADVRHGFRPL